MTEREQLEERLAAAEERIRELAESERHLAEAQAIAQIGSWAWNSVTDESTWSEEMYRIFGREPADGPLTGEQFFARVHPDDRQRVAGEQMVTFNTGPAFASDYRIVTDAGEERVVHARGRMVGEGCYVGAVQDITQLRTSEGSLNSSERAALEQFRAAFARASVGMAVADASGRIVRVNETLSWLTGYTEDELCAMTALTLVHPDDLEQVRTECAPLQNGEDAVTYAHRVEHGAGHIIWVQASLAILRDETGVPLYSVLQMVDVSEQRVYEDELHHMADHDPLTGLLNRRGFEVALSAHLARCQRYGATGALLMIDLDGFKAVNDTYGHAAGDEILKSVASALSTRLRQSDVLARLGGDEFAVLLPAENREAAELVAQAVLDMVHGQATPSPDGPFGLVKASIGIALLTEGNGSADELMAQADLAMYASKANGKGRYTVHRPGLVGAPAAGRAGRTDR